eukprot:PLAT11938.1.p1 GENE.PLAT11938.1~~PLAT11938.1.p1  ORF type:complete len:235 (-),score=32.17 PLAT11938.1:101-751(-)
MGGLLSAASSLFYPNVHTNLPEPAEDFKAPADGDEVLCGFLQRATIGRTKLEDGETHSDALLRLTEAALALNKRAGDEYDLEDEEEFEGTAWSAPVDLLTVCQDHTFDTKYCGHGDLFRGTIITAAKFSLTGLVYGTFKRDIDVPVEHADALRSLFWPIFHAADADSIRVHTNCAALSSLLHSSAWSFCSLEHTFEAGIVVTSDSYVAFLWEWAED